MGWFGTEPRARFPYQTRFEPSACPSHHHPSVRNKAPERQILTEMSCIGCYLPLLSSEVLVPNQMGEWKWQFRDLKQAASSRCPRCMFVLRCVSTVISDIKDVSTVKLYPGNKLEIFLYGGYTRFFSLRISDSEYASQGSIVISELGVFPIVLVLCS